MMSDIYSKNENAIQEIQKKENRFDIFLGSLSL